MAIAVRDTHSGRASSRYSDDALYGLVRHIATWVNRRQPTRITMVEFDNARASAQRPEAPSARAICMRLGRDGKSLPWVELLNRACTEGSTKILHGKAAGGGEAPHLTQAHLYFALNAVANHLDQRTLTPADYERGREQLIEAEARRRTGRHPHQPHLLAELLPNADQIVRIAKNAAAGSMVKSGSQGVPSDAAAWDHALRLAELEPRATMTTERVARRRSARTLSIAEAIHWFVESNDRWPSVGALERFARAADVAVARERGTPWQEHLQAATRLRDSLGKESPPLPDGRVPRWLTGTPIVAPDHIPGAPKRDQRSAAPGEGRVQKEDALDALDRFDRELVPGVKRTRKRYVAFAVEHGLPSATTIDRRFGGFKTLMTEMRRRREESG